MDKSFPLKQKRKSNIYNLRKQKRLIKVKFLQFINFEKEQLELLIDKYKMPYYCISAKTGNNIEQLFFKIVEKLDKLEAEKHNKIKQTYSEEYENPPVTVQSLTRSETKENTIGGKQQDDKEKLSLVTQKNKFILPMNCKC